MVLVGLINSRPYHHHTNGQLERFHKSLEDEIWNYSGLDDYIEYHNTDRLHFSLDMDNYETPMMAFRNKADEETRMRNPNWMEDDIMTDGQNEARRDFRILQHHTRLNCQKNDTWSGNVGRRAIVLWSGNGGDLGGVE